MNPTTPRTVFLRVVINFLVIDFSAALAHVHNSIPVDSGGHEVNLTPTQPQPPPLLTRNSENMFLDELKSKLAKGECDLIAVGVLCFVICPPSLFHTQFEAFIPKHNSLSGLHSSPRVPLAQLSRRWLSNWQSKPAQVLITDSLSLSSQFTIITTRTSPTTNPIRHHHPSPPLIRIVRKQQLRLLPRRGQLHGKSVLRCRDPPVPVP